MSSNGIILNVVKKLTSIFYIQHSHCTSCNGISKNWKFNVPEVVSVNSKMKYAVLILDRPIVLQTDYFRQFWNNATVRVTIDGGTRQWDRFYHKQPEDVQKTLKIPDLITGDFDSVTPELLETYKKKGCKTVYTPDQYHTDFTKCLMELDVYCKDRNIEMDNVIAIGESSGRLDQIIGNIQTLFLNMEKKLLNPKATVYLLSDDALSWLLNPGEHLIIVPEDSRTQKGVWCSLIPIGSACEVVSSAGLKWNLDNQPLRFGELVSTSNAFSGSEKVTIKCSHPLLWSMRIPSLMNGNGIQK